MITCVRFSMADCCYLVTRQNQLITCPINKAALIAGSIIAGSTCFDRLSKCHAHFCTLVALLIGLVSYCAVCSTSGRFSGLCACAWCSLCKRRKKTKVSDGEKYEQLLEPSNTPVLVSERSVEKAKGYLARGPAGLQPFIPIYARSRVSSQGERREEAPWI